MPCPTCGHTLANLGIDSAARRVFWCPRCGTLKTEVTTPGRELGDGTVTPDRHHEEHEAPKSAERVGALLTGIAADSRLYGLTPTVRTQRNLATVRETFGIKESE